LKNSIVEDLNNISLENCAGKYTVDLEGNKITAMGENLQRNLKNVRELKLKSNKIMTMGENSFGGLTKLKFIVLRNNKIYKLPKNAFSELLALDILWKSS
jgi:hypothetical protein